METLYWVLFYLSGVVVSYGVLKFGRYITNKDADWDDIEDSILFSLTSWIGLGLVVMVFITSIPIVALTYIIDYYRDNDKKPPKWL